MLDRARPFCAALLYLISFELDSSSTLFARRSWSIFRLVSLGGRLGKASSAKQSASKEPQFVKDGFLLFHISASESNRLAVRIEFPMAPRLERSADQGVSAFLGPLLLALDLAEQHRSVHYYGFASSDWNITASLPWRLGMPSDPKLTVTKMAKPGEKPMSNRDCPVRVEARLMELAEEDWPEEHGAPGRLNRSFHPKAPKAVRRSLLPYGCSSIRIAAFPALSLSEE